MAISRGGGGGIRTHGALSGPATFKVAAFGRSATPPGRSVGVRRRGQAVSGGGGAASRRVVGVGGGGGPGWRGGRCRSRPGRRGRRRTAAAGGVLDHGDELAAGLDHHVALLHATAELDQGVVVDQVLDGGEQHRVTSVSRWARTCSTSARELGRGCDAVTNAVAQLVAQPLDQPVLLDGPVQRGQVDLRPPGAFPEDREEDGLLLVDVVADLVLELTEERLARAVARRPRRAARTAPAAPRSCDGPPGPGSPHPCPSSPSAVHAQACTRARPRSNRAGRRIRSGTGSAAGCAARSARSSTGPRTTAHTGRWSARPATAAPGRS